MYGIETAALSVWNTNILGVTQRVMELVMLDFSLRTENRNEERRKSINIADVIQRIASLKWKWAGHVARQSDVRSAATYMVVSPVVIT